MLPEWIPVVSPFAGLAGLFIWLVRAVVSGQLVPGRQVERMLEAQQRIIDQQAAQTAALLETAQLTNRVVASLPTPKREEKGVSP